MTRSLQGKGETGQPEVRCQLIQDHARCTHLALKAVTGNVRGGNDCPLEQAAADNGLSLPGIHNGHVHAVAVNSLDESGCIHNRAAGGVDKYGSPLKLAKEGTVSKMVCCILTGPCQRRVHGYDIAGGCKLVKGVPLVAPLGALTGRVAEHHVHIQAACPLLNNPADMSNAHNTYFILRYRPVGQMSQGRQHILGNGRGIAARGVGGLDAVVGAPFLIYVVKAYGCRTHKADAAAGQQVGVAFGARAHQQGVGIADNGGGDLLTLAVEDLSVRLKHTLQVGDIGLDDYFQTPASSGRL